MITLNVPTIERLLRLILGAGVAAYAIFIVPSPSPLVAALGACLALTGLIGFCPACALAGRRLRAKSVK